MIAPANPLNHRKLYRLPWSPTDNIISWLEPTKNCNIHCHGCYSANVTGSHKSIETIEHELDVFERFRQTDAVSIAGGEPLTHPQIVDVVRRVAARGLKPVINTNGFALTPELLHELKAGGRPRLHLPHRQPAEASRATPAGARRSSTSCGSTTRRWWPGRATCPAPSTRPSTART